MIPSSSNPNRRGEPFAQAPSLIGISISASKFKYGIGEWDGHVSTPPKKYLTQTRTSSSNGTGTCGPDETLSTMGVDNYDRTTGVCTGYDSRNGGSGSDHRDGCGQWFFFADCEPCGNGLPDPDYHESYTNTTFSYTETLFDSHHTPPIACSSSGSVTMSNENTTEQVISDTEAALPAWPDWSTAGSLTTAFRDLSTDETNYSIRRIRWKVRHYPTGTCYMKVWLQSTFHPDSGSDVVTDLEPYIWTGSQTPRCLPDASKSITDVANRIDSTETEEDEPSIDGTVTISIAKYSFLDGYTPTGLSDSGWPV